MSKNYKSLNIKDAPNGTNRSSTAKKSGNKMIIMIVVGVVALLMVSVVFGVFLSGKQNAKKSDVKSQKMENADSAKSNNPAPPVPETKNNEDAGGRFEANGNNPFNAQSGTGGQPQASDYTTVFTDQSTQQQMIKTQNGTYLLNSPEGQYYFNEYQKSLANQNAGVNAQPTNFTPANQAGITQAAENKDLLELRENTTTQVKALDEKTSQTYSEVTALREIVKKQNETLEKTIKSIKEIEPYTKSSKQLARELFGSNGQKVLENRNNRIKVDAISPSGDVVYITNSDMSVSVLSVGDIVPNTTVKIKKIDPVNNSVIVSE